MFRYAILVFCLTTCLAARGQFPVIDSMVTDEMRQHHIAGLSLAVIKGGKVLVSRGYGCVDAEFSSPATEQTVYKIGSMSKHIVATCIMALIEQGKIKLTDPVKLYFPLAPASWDKITVRNLLDHTSGLERESPAFRMNERLPDSMVIAAAYNDPLIFPTGTKWQYCNLGYFLLADIIRKVTGESFEDYMNQTFDRLGLHNTATTTKSHSLRKAKGYRYNDMTGQNTEVGDFPALRPSGAFSSNIIDLIRWDSIQWTPALLSKSGYAKMWSDTVKTGKGVAGNTSYYGYGWFVLNAAGHIILNHGGNTPGFSSEYWRGIEDKVSVIILTNANEQHLGSLAKKIYISMNPYLDRTAVNKED